MKSYLDVTTLTFESKDERDEHPLAGLIPDSLWKHADLFNNQLTPFSIKYMKGHPKELVEDFSFTGNGQNKRLIWVCNALSNPQAIDNLKELAQVLKLNVEDTFSLACHIGNIPLIASMLEGKSNEEKLVLIEHETYSAYRGAIENPNSKVVAYLEKQVPGLVQTLKEEAFKKTFFILNAALQQGQLAVFHYLEAKNPQLNILVAFQTTHHGSRHNDFHHLLCLASQMGYLEIMDRFSPPADQIALDSYAVIRVAADNGQEKILDYFKQIYHTLNLDKYYNYKEIVETCISHAQKGGLLDLLSVEAKEESSFIDEIYKSKDFEAFRQAADNGHDLVVNHMLSNKNCLQYAANNDKYKPLYLNYEAANTKLQTLQELIAGLKTYGEELSAPDQNAFDRAEGSKTIRVANTLKSSVDEFIIARNLGDLDAQARAQRAFKDEWQKGYNELGTHRTPLRSILAEIAIAATLIGLLAIGIKYLMTGSTFFSQTKRQEHANEIDSAFDALYSVHPK